VHKHSTPMLGVDYLNVTTVAQKNGVINNAL